MNAIVKTENVLGSSLPVVGNLGKFDAEGNIIDAGIGAASISDNREIWAYQDFAAGVITGTSVTLTANNNVESGTGYFAVGDIISGTAGIFRIVGKGLPAYTGTLKIFSSKVRVTGQTADSITLSGEPNASWGDIRIWYKIVNRDAQVAYRVPALTVQGSIFAEFTSSLNASDIAFTPTGEIVSGDVSEALAELDQKKEKLANKEDTTLDTSTTKYPTNRLTKEYADGKVADAINDGTTTIAPSQNAVFDALALKEATANKDASGGYAGLTALKINFKNVLDTSTSFFTNSNTAARTYTFQDQDGTIADLADVATKETAFAKNTAFNKNFGTSASEVCEGNDTRLSDARQCNDTFNNATTSKTALSLNNVDNTSDLNKPVSTATQTALNLKEPTITAGTTAQYWRGDKTWQTLDKASVGLGNVVNVNTQIAKSISSATQVTVNTATPTIIASATITPRSTSSVISLTATGDMNAAVGGNWHVLQLYRDSTAIGKLIVAGGDNNSTNVPFALVHIDSPASTSSITYSVKANQGSGSCTYGESGDDEAPTLVVLEFIPA